MSSFKGDQGGDTGPGAGSTSAGCVSGCAILALGGGIVSGLLAVMISNGGLSGEGAAREADRFVKGGLVLLLELASAVLLALGVVGLTVTAVGRWARPGSGGLGGKPDAPSVRAQLIRVVGASAIGSVLPPVVYVALGMDFGGFFGGVFLSLAIPAVAGMVLALVMGPGRRVIVWLAMLAGITVGVLALTVGDYLSGPTFGLVIAASASAGFGGTTFILGRERSHSR